MRVEETLAKLIHNHIKFKLKIPNRDKLFEPIYEINPSLLIEGSLVGHIFTMLDGHKSFLVSRIIGRQYASDENFAIDWPTSITTELILHSDDSRKLSELPISTLTLQFNSIMCHLIEI